MRRNVKLLAVPSYLFDFCHTDFCGFFLPFFFMFNCYPLLRSSQLFFFFFVFNFLPSPIRQQLSIQFAKTKKDGKSLLKIEKQKHFLQIFVIIFIQTVLSIFYCNKTIFLQLQMYNSRYRYNR